MPKSMPMQNRVLVGPCQAAAMVMFCEEEAGARRGGALQVEEQGVGRKEDAGSRRRRDN